MTNEELVKIYQDGDKSALDELIERNKGIVYKLVNRYYISKTNLIDKEDLMQEGYVGLMIAAEKYRSDLDNPCKFITYAVYWITSKISRYSIQKSANKETSLNVHAKDSNGSEIQDFIEGKDYGYENIEEQIYCKELRAELEDVMSKVNTLKEREILKLRYGWDDTKDMSNLEVAELYEVSRQRIQQIESKALTKMRNTTWGRLKAKELFHDMEICNGWSTPGTIERINFAEKYLREVI